MQATEEKGKWATDISVHCKKNLEVEQLIPNRCFFAAAKNEENGPSEKRNESSKDKCEQVNPSHYFQDNG